MLETAHHLCEVDELSKELGHKHINYFLANQQPSTDPYVVRPSRRFSSLHSDTLPPEAVQEVGAIAEEAV